MLCHKTDGADGLVVGIYGTWGCGKTSTLNMLKQNIGDKAIVVNFNPWAFPNQNLAIKNFLFDLANAIQDVMPEDNNDSTKLNQKLYRIPFIGERIRKKTASGTFTLREGFGDILEQYARKIITMSSEIPGAKPIKHLENGATILNKSNDLNAMKQKLNNLIRTCKKRIIVFVDDIDRLDSEETFYTFRVIKNILNFSGVVYVLAFDDYAVGKSLNPRFEGGVTEDAGRKYLEKIVQVPLRLPALRREDLDLMLIDAIGGLLSDNGIALTEEEGERFRVIYDDSFYKFFDTPRAIYRYINALRFLLPSVKGEVNLVDFLVLEIVRIFRPEVYTSIFNNKKLFVKSTPQDFSVRPDDMSLRDKINSRFNTEDLSWLQELFPHINSSEDRQHLLFDNHDTLEKRICFPEYFDKYFVYGVSQGNVSDNAINTLVRLEDEQEIGNSLALLLTSPATQGIVLRRIQVNIELCAHPEKLASALMDNFELLCPETVPFNLPILQTASLLVVNLALRTLTPDAFLLKIINSCNNPEYLFYLVRSTHLTLSNKENRVRYPELWEYLQPIIARKVQEVAKVTILHSSKYPHGHLLYKYWADFSSKATTNQYLQNTIRKANEVLDFLTRYLVIWQSQSGSTYGDFDNEALDSICRVAETAWMYDFLKEAYPQHDPECKYAHFNDFDGDLNILGREYTDEFRNILAQQFMALVQRRMVAKDM